MVACLLAVSLGTNLGIGAMIGGVLFWSEVWWVAGEVTAKAALVAAALLEPPEENLPEDQDRPLPTSLLLYLEQRRLRLAASTGMTAV
ncbi:MAG: hypothetical protein Q8O75_03590 [bacterium]|nr:hypothetical protein [bacterium]